MLNVEAFLLYKLMFALYAVFGLEFKDLMSRIFYIIYCCDVACNILIHYN
jgi:hypothetical protein